MMFVCDWNIVFCVPYEHQCTSIHTLSTCHIPVFYEKRPVIRYSKEIEGVL